MKHRALLTSLPWQGPANGEARGQKHMALGSTNGNDGLASNPSNSVKSKSLRPEQYTIGWITALPVERAAATALLNDRHEAPIPFDQHPSDKNAYTWGRIGNHCVVIASLPAGVYGTTSAATTASGLVASLPHIRIGLLVGIGGAISRPDQGYDIRLGDVVVGQPNGTMGGVVQYDLGKVMPGQSFERKGSLNQPPQVLLHALSSLQAEHEIEPSTVPDILENMLKTYPRMKGPTKSFVHQGFENDRLFSPEYCHVGGKTCDLCDDSKTVARNKRETTDPEIHYGLIASGNMLLKDAETRDKVLRIVGDECICVEMEAAGLMNHFPCLVIRGISDYADSHKNDRWQRYAAATAAAFAVELLSFVHTQQLESTQTFADIVSSFKEDLNDIRLLTIDTKKEAQMTSIAVQNFEEKIVLQGLPIAAGASFDSYEEEGNQTCLPGTRSSVLQQITDWVYGPSSKPLFWLNGMAGTGKSTISRTIAGQFAQSHHLGASFFFKRGEPDRGCLLRFFTTIASHLARTYPMVAPYIKSAVNKDPSITGKATQRQFQKLILEPLRSVPLHAPKQILVLVIDALDECDQEEDIELIIKLFSLMKGLEVQRIRIVLTSRPELPIRLGFQGVEGMYQDLILHEIAPNVIKDDIATYLTQELVNFRLDYNTSVSAERQLPAGWPGDKNLEALIEMAIPLFIFAVNLCRFLADRRGQSPDKKLQTVLQLRTRSQNSKLAATYLPVLDNLIIGLHGEEKTFMLKQFKSIVGSIVILAGPLSVHSLGQLLGISQDAVNNQLDMLHSVLNVPTSSTLPVRLFHSSFRDFLVDPEQQAMNPFWVDEKRVHERMAHNCIRVMAACLKNDICRLIHPGTLRSSISLEHISRYIPPHVRYASLYWVFHLQQSGITVDDDSAVYPFLKIHFLHWLEALGLIGRISESLDIIHTLQSLHRPEKGCMLADFIKDGLRCIRSFRTIIDSAPLQVYSSVLAFLPKNSTVKQNFQDQMPDWISLAPTPDDEWSQDLQVFEGATDEINAVAFSPDGILIASGPGLRIWRASDGVCLQEFINEGNTCGLAFSPCGRYVAICSERCTQVWAIEEGETVLDLNYGAFSIDYSPDGELLALGSPTQYGPFGTTLLLNSGNGKCIQILERHLIEVQSVAFSPDGKILASGSLDRTVKLWNVENGEQTRMLKLDDGVLSVAFSPNGQLIAIGSLHATLSIWDLGSGKCIQRLRSHWTSESYGSISKLAFSPSGDFLASCSRRSVQIWDGETFEFLGELRGHGGDIRGLAVSPTGELIATGSIDRTVRIWSSRGDLHSEAPKGHKSRITFVGFSPDGEQIVSVSDPDKNLRVWSGFDGQFKYERYQDRLDIPWESLQGNFALDGELITSNFDYSSIFWRSNDETRVKVSKLLPSLIARVAFSRDKKLMAMSCKDSTEQVWESGTRKCVYFHNPRLTSAAIRRLEALAISPDGKFIASSYSDFSIRLAEIKKGSNTMNIKFPNSSAKVLEFFPRSKLLASASSDTIRIWSTKDGTCKQIIYGLHSQIEQLIIDPSECFISTQIGQIRISLGVSLNHTVETEFSECLIGAGITEDGHWITWRGSRLLWLPLPYRAQSGIGAMHRSTIALGCPTGRLVIMRFQAPAFESWEQ